MTREYSSLVRFIFGQRVKSKIAEVLLKREKQKARTR